MAHIREIRPQAREVKFVVDATLAGPIRQWARAHLDADIHGGGPHGDEYRTDQRLFRQRRLRRLSPPRLVRPKQISHPPVWRRARPSSSSARCASRRCSPSGARPCRSRRSRRLTDSDSRHRMARLLVPPAGQCPAAPAGLQVAYSRMARSVLRDGEPVRLTLDCRPSGAPGERGSGFLDEANLPALPAMSGRLILELKYRGETPAIFRQLVEEFALAPQSAVEVSPRRRRASARRSPTKPCPAPNPEPKRFYA